VGSESGRERDIKNTGESWAAAATTAELGGGDFVVCVGVGDRGGGGVGKLEIEQRRGRVWREWYLHVGASPPVHR
jgi:hypothetical protein